MDVLDDLEQWSEDVRAEVGTFQARLAEGDTHLEARLRSRLEKIQMDLFQAADLARQVKKSAQADG